jgi:hypothetical protein
VGAQTFLSVGAQTFLSVGAQTFLSVGAQTFLSVGRSLPALRIRHSGCREEREARG